MTLYMGIILKCCLKTNYEQVLLNKNVDNIESETKNCKELKYSICY